MTETLASVLAQSARVREVLAASGYRKTELGRLMSDLLDTLLDDLEEVAPKTWAGLMSILDEYYPDDIFPTADDREGRDYGARIVSLVRHLDASRATETP